MNVCQPQAKYLTKTFETLLFPLTFFVVILHKAKACFLLTPLCRHTVHASLRYW